MEIRTVHIDGRVKGDISYALWQPEGVSKGAVVCVHGLSRQKRDFDFVAEYLTKASFTVYAVDAPGRGGSMRFTDPDLYNVDVYADVFAEFLKQLGLKKVHWIGTSMGGLIAMMMAEKGYGNFFQTLTLVDITHKPNAEACKRIASYMTEEPVFLPDLDTYVSFLKNNLPLGDVPDNIWSHYAEHQLIRSEKGYTFHFDPKIARRALVDLKGPIDLGSGLAQIGCPVSLVAGGLSDLCTQAEVADFMKLKSQARLHMCPKAGHVPASADQETQLFIHQGFS